MLRIILGIVVGVVTCAMLVTVGGLIIRESWREYAAVERAMTFTQPMLFTRLALSSIALLMAAWVTTLIVRKSFAALILGIVLLLVSIPIHINLWDKFPVWYHLTFLLTLIPLCILGGRIVRSAGRMEQTKTTVILSALFAISMPAWRAHAQAPPQTKNDYSKAETWLCRPGRQDACAADLTTTIVAANGKLTEEKWKANPNAPIDCFYVYPTVSNDPTPNSDMNAGPEERSVVQHQFARFGSQCRPYAPLYRQITLTALRANLSGRPMRADRALGYNDVLDAWKYYLEHDNQGRGVVLIGHSQGSGVLIQLIKNEIDGKPIQDRVVSALLLGMNVAVPAGKDVGGAFQKMPLCRATNQTGCVISYVTFRENAPPPSNSFFGRAPGYGMVVACTNPAALGGGRGELHAYLAAGRSANTSSAQPKPWATPEQPIKTPFVSVPGLLSAQCTSNEHGSYLALRVHGAPADPRTDDIVGDVVVNGQVQSNWGLHLIDVQAAMGNLVNIVGQQAQAYQAKKKK